MSTSPLFKEQLSYLIPYNYFKLPPVSTLSNDEKYFFFNGFELISEKLNGIISNRIVDLISDDIFIKNCITFEELQNTLRYILNLTTLYPFHFRLRIFGFCYDFLFNIDILI